jgi:integrase/recombinase XerD
VRLQRVVMPGSEAVSWTVLADSGEPVAPIEAYLSFLCAIERSPNTVRHYAVGLKLFFEFLDDAGLSWREAGVDDVARFVAWLRAPDPDVIGETLGRQPATVNQILAAVFGCYDYLARLGVTLSEGLVAWRRAGRRSYTPFLYQATKANPIKVRPLRLAVPRRAAKTLTVEQIVAILAACEHLRDRFLFALMAETGVRVGQALGLRHADIDSASRQLCIVPRADNANGARAKTRDTETIPVSAALLRLCSEYMHAEYGTLDSDYVFVNLWAEPWGQPLTYNAVNQLVRRLRARTGISFTAHMFRHSAATEMVRAGVPIEVVRRLLTHRSSATTSAIYVHLLSDDLRAALPAGRYRLDDDGYAPIPGSSADQP